MYGFAGVFRCELRVALRTGTIVKWSVGDPGDLVIRNPGNLRRALDEREQSLLSEVIVDEAAFSTGGHPTGFPQRHQVL